jgi:DNA-binding transcriptional ArsR family regulator
MAKKSLKNRIDDLFNALGGSEKPAPIEIRSELSELSLMAEALENGEALREAKAKVTVLEAALEKSESETGKLKAELEAANAKIQRFLAEEKKRQDKERDIPPIQLEILERLSSEQSGQWLVIGEVARAIGRPVDETEVHLKKLRKAGLVDSIYNQFDALVWHRSDAGNELVLAKRLSEGKEEGKQKIYKYAQLPPIQHEALLMMVGKDEGANEREIAKRVLESLPLTKHNLRLLEEAGMATDGDEPDYGTGRCWILMRKGTEYLAERELL